MPAPLRHIPVLVNEVLAALQPVAGARVIDATVNGGGHARVLLRHLAPGGRLLGLDRDPTILAHLRQAAADEIASGRLRLALTSFAHLAAVAATEGFSGADAVLFDLGLSSYHLEGSGRGFSFERDEPLDLRFDPTDRNLPPAAELLRRTHEAELARLIATYGEERFARRIARRIVTVRVRTPITTAAGLRDCVLAALPPPLRRHGQRNVARVFQALRIATNRELEAIEQALPQAVEVLRPGGRLAVIAFHSLEDRLVKQFLRGAAAAGRVRVLTKKPIRPEPAEVAANSRAASARLRAAERT
jgi:16S rRNA (cytosine1402-N4)-methyltransferase